MASAAEAAPRLEDLPPRIVFFDGVCTFCDGAVRWLMDRDPDAKLRYAPLQGATAETVRTAFPGTFPVDIDTMVYLRPGPHGAPALLLRSRAIFAVLRELGGAWGWLGGALALLPQPFTDWGYHHFVRNRYRWFGKMDACRVPTAEDRERSLD